MEGVNTVSFIRNPYIFKHIKNRVNYTFLPLSIKLFALFPHNYWVICNSSSRVIDASQWSATHRGDASLLL